MLDSTTVEEFGILLDIGPFNLVKITCLINQKPISFYSSEIPSSFRSLARKFMSYDALPKELYEYILNHTNELVVYVLWEGEYVKLDSQLDKEIHRKILFQVQGDTVFLNRVGTFGDVKFSNLIPIGELFVVNIEQKSLHIFSELDGWLLWDSFNKYISKHTDEIVKPKKKMSGIKARNVLTSVKNQIFELK